MKNLYIKVVTPDTLTMRPSHEDYVINFYFFTNTRILTVTLFLVVPFKLLKSETIIPTRYVGIGTDLLKYVTIRPFERLREEISFILESAV